jgi:RND family efflux transporter MFP subunit
VGSRQDARVASSESGRVIRIAEVGSVVKRGAVLARINDQALALALSQAEANLHQVETRHAFAERQVARMDSITQRSNIAAAQLDQVRADRDALRHQGAQARAALADARRRHREASIRAPFDGTVVERFIEVGEHIGAGAAVVRLVDTVNLEIIARAPVALAATLKSGAAVEIREGRRTQSATLRAVVPVGDAQSRQLEVRVALAASAWTVGTAVEVGLPSESIDSRGIAVPRDALVLRSEGSYVFRVSAENIAERLTVETGKSHGALTVVFGALASGDQLVVRGAERLQPGQSVRVVSAASL